jgi:hypothetical protein
MNSAQQSPPATGIRGWTADRFAILTAVIGLLAFLETHLARWPGRPRLDHPMFERLFAYDDHVAAGASLALLALVALVRPLRAVGARWAHVLGARPGAVALLTFVLLALAARFVYHAHPLAMDESVPLAQAYAFAHGHLSWVLPADLLAQLVPEGFRGSFLAVDPGTGRMASLYWPGFAALLAPWALVGVPWLLNPLLTALTLMLLHRLALRLFADADVAGWVLLLTLASPAVIANGISFYSMPAHLAANLLYALLLTDPRPRRALLAGLVGGLALTLHNPVPHLLFALPWGVWLVLSRARWPALAMLIVGYLPGLAVTALWPQFANHFAPLTPAAASGDFASIVHAKVAQVLALPSYGTVLFRLTGTWKLWLWSAPGLMLLAAAGLRRARGPLGLLALSAALTYFGYWFVPVDQGHGWGYRYFHSAWGVLPLLAVAGFSGFSGEATRAWRDWVGGFAAASLVAANVLRLWQVEANVSEHLAQRIPEPETGHAVRLIAGQDGLYTWDLVQNVPGRDRTLTLFSLGDEADRALMRRRFPGATPLVVDARGSLWRIE